MDYCDSPVNEIDLHARHKWLVYSDDAVLFRERMRTDPDYYDPKIAGWWCWGICCWIGGGWCSVPTGAKGERIWINTQNVPWSGKGVTNKVPKGGRPQLADAYDIGRGVHSTPNKRPSINTAFGYGINSNTGTCEERRAFLLNWFNRLRDRLRNVRVCCGHWDRVCSSTSTTTRLGLTAIFLDPPYPTHGPDGEESRSGDLYSGDDRDETDKIRDEVLAYCRKHGDDPQMRLAVCGYDTDGYAALEELGWIVHKWKTGGGYANRGGYNENMYRERIWFSPHCIHEKIGFGLCQNM